jgi:hypothetical protein
MLIYLVLLYYILLSILNNFKEKVTAIPLIILLFLWVAVNCADAHSTLLFLKKDIEEGNWLCRKFINRLGYKKGVILFKLILLPPSMVLILYYLDKVTTLTLILVFMFIALRNYYHGLANSN